jgi:hypothetical protein
MTLTISSPLYDGAGASVKMSRVTWLPRSHHDTGRRKPE